MLGTTWSTSFHANASTAITAVVVVPGGPATGPMQWNGELLVSVTPWLQLVTGIGDSPIPNNPAISGFAIATLGFRLDTSSGLVFVPLNAQDIQIGMSELLPPACALQRASRDGEALRDRATAGSRAPSAG